ncbi:MAG: metal-dependent hydrolase [Hyphomicrobiaceae bacterium]
MANFTTHIAVGTVVSGAAATLTLAANVISPESLVAVTLAGVVGSILPDIDLKDSRPSRALFAGLAVFFSFCALFVVAPRYSIAEMWLVWLGTLGLVRYGAHTMFHHFSYHRGIWHSIIAGLFFWFLTAVIYHRMLGLHEGVAWLAGGFVFLGYLTHLILDEIYSVDVFDRRLKASFGSALKLYDGRHLSDSAVVAALAVLAFVAAPPSKPFIEGITSYRLWAGLQHRLLPEDKWFGVLNAHRQSAGNDRSRAADVTAMPPAATSGVTTGSIPKADAETLKHRSGDIGPAPRSAPTPALPLQRPAAQP